jgi:hypothetical protein
MVVQIIALIGWLAMLDEIIRESPAYKMMTKKAYEEGVKEGLERVLEQVRQEELQQLWQLLVKIVKARFPRLERLAKKQGIVIEEAKVLADLIVKVSAARTMEEARQHLLAVDEGEDDL